MRALSLSLALLLWSATASAQDATERDATEQDATEQAATEQAATDEAATAAPGEAATDASTDEGATVAATDAPGADLSVHEAPAEAPEDPVAAFFLGWKFWVGVAAILVGVTLAIVVDLTTDDPAPSPDPTMGTPMGLRLRF